MSSLSLSSNVKLRGILLAIEQRKQQQQINRTSKRKETKRPRINLHDNHDIIYSIDAVIFVAETVETALQKMKEATFDLNKGINELQSVREFFSPVTPIIFFSDKGDVRMVLFLLLLGASTTKADSHCFYFPMYVAARKGHLTIVQFLYKYGGDAKYDINKDNGFGYTPLSAAINNKPLETIRWVLLHGGAQQLSTRAVDTLRWVCRHYDGGRNFMTWIEENIEINVMFLSFLGGARLSSKCTSTRNERSLQMLNGQPGIMKLIGDYSGLLKGKELRMLQEFNDLMIQDNNNTE